MFARPLARPPCETPPLRDLKKFFARPQKFFQPRPVNCNNPYPLHREVVTPSILLLDVTQSSPAGTFGLAPKVEVQSCLRDPLRDPLARPPPLRDLKKFFARPQIFFQPRPVNCNSPYPLHREIVTQSMLLLELYRRF